MNKPFKILLFNILFIIGIIFIAEIVCFTEDYFINVYEPNHRVPPIEVGFPENYLKTYSFDEVYQQKKSDPNEMREPEGLEYKKKPIVIFGCSYALGDRLEVNQTLSHKLSKLMKCPVYNYASCSWGFQHMLYQLLKGIVFKEVTETPVYVIYVYIDAHIERMFLHTYSFPYNNLLYLNYKIKNGNFIENKPLFPLIERTSLYRKIYLNRVNERIHNPELFDENFNLMKLYFEKSREEMQKQWGNVKFIILKYEDKNDNLKEYFKSKRWKELEKEGFVVLNTTDLAGRKLLKEEDYADDNVHPSEEAWDLIIPQLIKKLNSLK